MEQVRDDWVARATWADGCLISMATPSQGRPRVRWGLDGGGEALLYVLTWAKEHGRMPPKRMHLHHRCGRSRCIFPKHLELVTPEEHSKIHGRLLTACKPKGHLYTPENTIRRKNGTRACRECKRERDRTRMPVAS